MASASSLPPPVAADLPRSPSDGRAEIRNGELVEKANPSAEHADAQGSALVHLRGSYHRRAGGDKPGGWWILPEVEIELAPHEVYCPDIAGWRRDNTPERPSGLPVKPRPDWICEVLSPATASRDLVTKL